MSSVIYSRMRRSYRGSGPSGLWDSIPDLALWVEPSYAPSITLDGSTVAAVAGRDKAGNGLSQTDTSKQLSLTGVVGSAQALLPEQAAFYHHHMVIDTPVSYPTNDFTMIVAVGTGTMSSTQYVIGGPVGGLGIRINTNGSVQVLRIGQLVLATAPAGSVVANTDYIIAVRGTYNSAEVIINGTVLHTNNYSTALTSTTSIVGGYYNGSTAVDRFRGAVGTIGIYTRRLSDQELDIAAGIAAATHSITWSRLSPLIGFGPGFGSGFS